MEQRIRTAIARSGADYTEVRVERSRRSRVFYQRDKLEGLETASELGGVVRCLKKGGWGVAVFNDLTRLEAKLAEAEKAAALVGAKTTEPVRLAPVSAIEAHVRAEQGRDVPLRRKKERMESYNRIILAESDKIVASNVHYRDVFREITYANSEGTYLIQEIPDTTLLLGAVASDGKGNIQQGFEMVGEAGGFDMVLHREEAARKAAQRATAMLDARSVGGGQYTVILDPELAGVFIHEAFGHFCEADFLFKNPRLAKIMTVGNEFGTRELNVVDEGYIAGRRGNLPYDDEGVARQKTYLIQEGRLRGLLHSRETAAKMGAEPTGNARAVSYEHPPIVRMRNTYIENGSSSFEEMIRDIDRGVYAIRAYGGETEFEQFSFSAAYAYEIIDGEIGGMLRDVVLTGNLFDTLRSIDRIGDDGSLFGGVGGCGKGGQNALPVTVGSPHIRIHNVTIGGK